MDDDKIADYEDLKNNFDTIFTNSINREATAKLNINYNEIVYTRYDIKDEKGVKKLSAVLLKPLFSRAHKKAAKAFPEIENYVSEYIKSQNALEADDCKSIDMAAEPTAKVMANTFALLGESENAKRALSRLGYCLGRYIYLLDAACDYEGDIKSGSYNVLKYAEGDRKEYVVSQLYISINEAAKAFELLKLKRYKTILGNIIYLGLEDTFKKELCDEQSV